MNITTSCTNCIFLSHGKCDKNKTISLDYDNEFVCDGFCNLKRKSSIFEKDCHHDITLFIVVTNEIDSKKLSLYINEVIQNKNIRQVVIDVFNDNKSVVKQAGRICAKLPIYWNIINNKQEFSFLTLDYDIVNTSSCHWLCLTSYENLITFGNINDISIAINNDKDVFYFYTDYDNTNFCVPFAAFCSLRMNQMELFTNKIKSFDNWRLYCQHLI